jgi:serine/threonine protein phosphatase PrpC
MLLSRFYRRIVTIVTSGLIDAHVEPALRIVVSAATSVGGRSENEDAIFVGEVASAPGADAGHVFVLADGMGGYQGGEVASEMAVAVVRDNLSADPGGDAALLLKQAFRRANEQIYQGGQGAEPPVMMGTTLVAVVTRGKYATIASIGDSRAYLARANRLTQVTKDHSLVADQVSKGMLSELEARESPHRNILTHALGHKPKLDPKMPNVFEITLLPEDKLLVCTDGFYDVVPNDDLLSVLLASDESGVAQQLVDLAVERGTSDNVSAIVASVLPVREPLVIAGPGTASRTSVFLPMIIATIVILAIAAAALYYFFVY